MLRLRYGNVLTKATGTEDELFPVRRSLSFFDKKLGEVTNLFSVNPVGTELTFASGLLAHVKRELTSRKHEFEAEGEPVLDDVTKIIVDPKILKGITLYDYQAPAVLKAIWKRRGIIRIPTGGGKTEISGAIVKHLADEKMISTLMIVPGVSSMHQTHERWQSRGIESIGRLGDRKKELDEAHLIAGIDALSASLKRGDKKLVEWLKGCRCVLFMECQHVPAKTWELIGNSLDVEYRIGLSATPFMNPGPPEQVRDFQLIGVTGEILADVDDFVVMNRGHMATPKVHFLPVGRTPALAPSEADWRSLKKHGLIEHEKRNNMIKGTAIALAQGGARVLVLVSEIIHGKGIARGVSRFVKNTFMFQGSSMLTHFRDGVELPSERMPITSVAKMLRELEDGYVLVGSPALDEDADFPDANVLIVAGAGRSFNKTIQRSGRVLRAKPGSNICHIIDFDDRSAWRLHAQANRRRELYASRYRGAKAFTIEDHHHPDEIVQLVVAGELGGNGDGGVEAVSVR